MSDSWGRPTSWAAPSSDLAFSIPSNRTQAAHINAELMSSARPTMQAVIPPRPDASPTSPIHSPSQPQPAPGLSRTEEALKASMSSPNFLDVKFFAFSRKYVMGDGSVRVDRPLPVLAISSVLKKIEDLDRLLSGGFAESSSKVDLNSGFPEYERPYSDEYDYDSDSDLDYEEDPVLLELDDDMQEEMAQGSSRGTKKYNGKDRAIEQTQSPSPGNCTQIIIRDAAYHTWRAFVFYLYTGKVNFLQLKSTNEDERNLEFVRALTDPSAVPPCSPKSMYRLADKYGLAELQSQAFTAIKSRLSTQNIVKEVFSKFTSRYSRVQELELSFLTNHYTHDDVTASLKSITDSIVQGDFPHAGDVLKTLLELNLNPSSRRATQYPNASSTSNANATFTGVGVGASSPGLAAPHQQRLNQRKRGFGLLSARPIPAAAWQQNRPLPPLVSSASGSSSAGRATNGNSNAQQRWSSFMPTVHMGEEDADDRSDDW